MIRSTRFMIALGMLLMLCGQTLAGSMMWCCRGGAMHEVMQEPMQEPMQEAASAPAPHAHAADVAQVPRMDMMHAMADARSLPQHPLMPSAAHEQALAPGLASVCAHHCPSCGGGSGLLRAPAPSLAESAPLALASMPGSPWLDHDPSLPFRPPRSV
jgi:hypothetical protein